MSVKAKRQAATVPQEPEVQDDECYYDGDGNPLSAEAIQLMNFGMQEMTWKGDNPPTEKDILAWLDLTSGVKPQQDTIPPKPEPLPKVEQKPKSLDIPLNNKELERLHEIYYSLAHRNYQSYKIYPVTDQDWRQRGEVAETLAGRLLKIEESEDESRIILREHYDKNRFAGNPQGSTHEKLRAEHLAKTYKNYWAVGLMIMEAVAERNDEAFQQIADVLKARKAGEDLRELKFPKRNGRPEKPGNMSNVLVDALQNVAGKRVPDACRKNGWTFTRLRITRSEVETEIERLRIEAGGNEAGVDSSFLSKGINGFGLRPFMAEMRGAPKKKPKK